MGAKVIILILIFIIIISVFLIIRNKTKNDTKMSFRESMDLTNLPVVTFYCDNIKLNFLLDTGSNSCLINRSVLKTIKYKEAKNEENTTDRYISSSGDISKLDFCELEISYKNSKFKSIFGVSDLSQTFDYIKVNTGVQIHGLLGSDFFNKYKYILDFKDLVAYIK